MKRTIGWLVLLMSSAMVLVPAASARDWDDHYYGDRDGRGRQEYQVQDRDRDGRDQLPVNFSNNRRSDRASSARPDLTASRARSSYNRGK
jgi:hypothetical protein